MVAGVGDREHDGERHDDDEEEDDDDGSSSAPENVMSPSEGS